MSNRIDRQIAKLPDAPGVYFFRDAKGEVLYIGKATSLKNRVRSYFREDIFLTRGPKIAAMLELVKKVDFEKTDSVLEALLLEAELIKKYQPKYNTDLKDDKTHNFVVITKEEFPRILIVRGREVFFQGTRRFPSGEARSISPSLSADGGTMPARAAKSLQKYFSSANTLGIFGPFPHGGQLREAMRIVRKIFPFRDKCTPAENQEGKSKPCFNAQIGLCPGVCVGKVSKQEYARTVRNIRLFFEGKKKMLIRKLKREMGEHAKRLEFEKADVLKKQIFALEHIRDVALIKNEKERRGGSGLDDSGGSFRIEAYDVAHISGTNAVGVMTVVEDGEAKKSGYRKFKIQSFSGADDTRALREILERRLAHPEWRYPNLIAVDGGKAQVNVAEKILKEAGIDAGIFVVGVVKDEKHRPREILGNAKIRREYEREILLANAEAHRFALKYHREMRGKTLRSS